MFDLLAEQPSHSDLQHACPILLEVTFENACISEEKSDRRRLATERRLLSWGLPQHLHYARAEVVGAPLSFRAPGFWRTCNRGSILL